MKKDILGVNVDQITMDQVVDQVSQWINGKEKHYVVTPNIEFVMLAGKDEEFRKILNNADLAIPDSARFSWALDLLNEKNLLKKLLKWPFFLMPKILGLHHFDIVTGTDLMDQLIKRATDQGFTVGFLGGQKNVALKLKERLQKKYPSLKVSYAESNVEVSMEGDVPKVPKVPNVPKGKEEPGDQSPFDTSDTSDTSIDIPPTDLLFVAFGQGKQEKWIAKNLNIQPVKVMIGVGGAFDYLSGDIKRAPLWMRKLGLEWLFRIILQPWRIKRFFSILKFIFLVLK